MVFLRLIYNLLFPVVLVVMLPSFIARMVRRGNYRHKFGQRFGIYSKRVLDKLGGQRWTWIHAVSVGEVMIALKLVQALRERYPDLRVVLSTTTSTGFRLAHRHKSPCLEPIYHPLDFPWVTSRAFAAIRPERLILVEAEVWPNTVALARKLGIPRVLVNARLSTRSEKRYRLVRWLSGPLFNCLDAICVQEPADVQRWVSLGVNPSRIRLTGSIKFDIEGSPTAPARDFYPVLQAMGIPPTAPVLLGGSTFDGEEILLAELATTLRTQFPELFLILVPRHAERGKSVLEQMEKRGFRATLRSGGTREGRPDILIVNTTGELRDWYACATVVFIGKSLATSARGGQNPAEAIVAGKPVIFGPKMQNFASLANQLVAGGGAVQVNDAGALSEAVAALLNDPILRERMVEEAAKCLDVHCGATRRTVEILASPQLVDSK